VPGTGGNFDYTISLKNTGTESLNSFWYAWTPGVFDLPTVPTSAANSSLGWIATIDGDSIQWQNIACAPALAAGQSETFRFDSTSPLSAITTSPSGRSVAFTTDKIQFNAGMAGQSTPVFAPTIAAVPEPSALGLLTIGSLIMAGSFNRLIAARSRQTARFRGDCALGDHRIESHARHAVKYH